MNQEPVSKSLLFCLELFPGLVVVGFLGFLTGIAVRFFGE